MTMPNERTRSFIQCREFLGKLASPYEGGFKRIPKDVREAARRILRHFPYPGDLGRAAQFDNEIIEDFYTELSANFAKKFSRPSVSAPEEQEFDIPQRPVPMYIDPPSGWKYGFPKIYDKNTDGEVNEWLIKNGYPAKMIEELGDAFYCRFWLAEPEVAEAD